jgi:predicted TIM-barrel fold metal-dependent hydrolase
MRVVTLEEHVAFPEMLELIPAEKHSSAEHSTMMGRMMPKLADITSERLKSMDDKGITVQVLSVVNDGADLLSPGDGPAFAKQYNDTIAQKIKDHPDRFAAFAHLPMTNPGAAADELERTVKTYGL